MRSTKKTIVHLGDELIRRNGYNAFSYADIAKSLQVKNAPIHYHFPSKSDLATAIVDWHIQSFERYGKSLHRNGPRCPKKDPKEYYTGKVASKRNRVDLIITYSIPYLNTSEITLFV